MKSQDNIERILIAVEDSPYSDQAIRYGVMLAKKMGSQIAMVHADEIPVSTPYIADPMLSETPLMIPEMIEIQEEASKNLFKRIVEQYGEGIMITKFIRVGRAQDEILAVADEYNADLIILGTHGRTGLDHFISGSVSASVAKRARCPVLIIPKKEA
ncbi:universal stress protein [Daejeonella sp.]|uniref:universal stress protein n=1 Tax=Daejeonella sp. TaxID=2805397 RepID=UPI00398302EC